MWQSSRPASFSPAGLTLWLSWLERWLATLSGLSVQVRNQWGCQDITLGARPQAWVKLSALIVHSEPTDCHVSLWPGENGRLPDRGFWCHWGREECDNPAGLLASRQRVSSLWPSWLERWLTTLSGLSVQVRNQWGCRDITLIWQIYFHSWCR